MLGVLHYSSAGGNCGKPVAGQEACRILVCRCAEMRNSRSETRSLLSSVLRVRTITLPAALLSLLLSFPSWGVVIDVPGDQPTIQDAIDVATTGATVVVHPDTYFENINFNGKTIVVRSTDPTSPPVVASTIIDGGSSDSVVTFAGTELTTCVLSGFTITYGRAEYGAGVNGNGTLATIQYNTISTNSVCTTFTLGGGLYDCDGSILNNVISDNEATSGGGLCRCDGPIQNNTICDNAAYAPVGYGDGGGLYDCDGTIEDNLITGNRAGGPCQGRGGGLHGCDGTIQNNTISTNSAVSGLGPVDTWGGGLYDCDGPILANVISGNHAMRGGGLHGCDGTVQDNTISHNSGSGLYDCDGTIRNNTISGNDGAGYMGIAGGGLYGCDGTVEYNNICDNSASGMSGSGGGLYDCDGSVQNNTICRNVASGKSGSGGGLHGCDGTIASNMIWDNEANGMSASGGGLYDCQAVIEGNAISGNWVDSDHPAGGGLQGCDGLIQDNIISGNWVTATWGDAYGGGLAYCDGLIDNNAITNNLALGAPSEAGYGGGLYVCTGTIQNNRISGNIALWGGGGGIFDCDGAIQNNVVWDNMTGNPGSGGGIADCAGTIWNNTIYGNWSVQGGGLSACTGTIRNCIVWENWALASGQLDGCSTPSYSCIQDWLTGGAGNIAANPELVAPGGGDFHLLDTSPCIDAGGTVTLTHDFEGDPRPFDFTPIPRGDGSDFDIGADEYYVAPAAFLITWPTTGTVWQAGTMGDVTFRAMNLPGPGEVFLELWQEYAVKIGSLGQAPCQEGINTAPRQLPTNLPPGRYQIRLFWAENTAVNVWSGTFMSLATDARRWMLYR